MASGRRIGPAGRVCSGRSTALQRLDSAGAGGRGAAAGVAQTAGWAVVADAHGAGMAGWWRALARAAQRHPWPTNVLLYAGLYSSGDALQQQLRGGPADWRQTRRVATLAVTFHANFNYVWLRLLERALPGRAPRTVLAKVLCDQTFGGPVALSAFYIGERQRTRD